MKESLLHLKVHIEANKENSHLLNQKEEYVKILKRLKEESNIMESIDSNSMMDLNFLSDVNIVEAA